MPTNSCCRLHIRTHNVTRFWQSGRVRAERGVRWRSLHTLPERRSCRGARVMVVACALAVIRKDLNHPAIGDSATTALPDHPLEPSPEHGEAADPHLHVA